MKKYQKILALSLSTILAVSLFAGCDSGSKDDGGSADQNTTNPGGTNPGGETDSGGETKPGGETDSGGETKPGGETDSGGETNPDPVFAGGEIICYDNLPDDNISLSEEDTKVVVEKGLDVSKFSVTPRSKKYTDVATYDAATGTFTAVGAGTIGYEEEDGDYGRITVVPAYVEDPGNQYTDLGNDASEATSKYLGRTHDPSFVESVNKSGKSTYYLFSTGWADQTTDDGVRTYGNAIHSSTDLITWKYVGRTFDVATRNEDFVTTKAGKWLYDGYCQGYSEENASWWAPDIVPCPNGGYWLYTCVVDGSGDDEGMALAGGKYARACILLYYSKTLRAGSFKPVTDANGDPVVLMQSSILRGESVADVNGIDPQIIYDTDGKMYMAYGSFGSGDYMIELDPETGLRKDGKGWQTQEEIRSYVNDIQKDFGSASSDSIGWPHDDYYGQNISKANMEAPVIARHDNVTLMDENEQLLEGSGKTYYYTMHSYDGLGDNYQMWGGRSESVWGVYKSVGGGIVRNVGPGNNKNSGNKYMGAFRWTNKSAGVKEYDIILPGHNDLYTTQDGVSLAAYITRIPKESDPENTGTFMSQVHQYYLNSLGHIVINPNRYGKEIDRSVSEEELLAYTETASEGAYKFKMVVMINQRDTASGNFYAIQNESRDVYLKSDHTITESNGTKLGTWKMYGKGYIKFTFDATLKGTNNKDSGNKIFYGVVRPAWLGDQNKSGFTITCLGSDTGDRNMAMFMNNYSTLTGGDLVG